MRVTLTIDGHTRQIDTANTALLGAWLTEQFMTVEWHPATYCTVNVWPGFKPDGPDHAKFNMDWLTDSRHLGTPYGPVRTPREVLAALSDALDAIEQQQWGA